MNVTVLLAGITDPKWPLGSLDAYRQGGWGAVPRILSPFDESALEIGLRLRDARAGTGLRAIVLGGPESDALLRRVASFRLDEIVGVALEGLAFHDAQQVCSQLAPLIAEATPAPDLVLMGREFGDWDDGTAPPCLAERLGWSFLGLVQHAELTNTSLRLMRERTRSEEWVNDPGRIVASITNERRNRLRHPLLKNVMAAKRAQIPIVHPAEADAERSFSLLALDAAAAGSRRVACRLVEGPVDRQAQELAGFLAPWRRNRK